MGTNESFYLQSGTWYRMLSPLDFWSVSYARVIDVNNDGHISSSWVHNYDGGVRPVVSLAPSTNFSGRKVNHQLLT